MYPFFFNSRAFLSFHNKVMIALVFVPWSKLSIK
uniref:Uncharacterized protein n=1 Tax=Arundo donax TaxID=35708 RepID=A0A0A8ZN76_ARUDO